MAFEWPSFWCTCVQVKGALERALMATRFRKEFVDVYVKTYVNNAKLRVAKVPKTMFAKWFFVQLAKLNDGRRAHQRKT